MESEGEVTPPPPHWTGAPLQLTPIVGHLTQAWRTVAFIEGVPQGGVFCVLFLAHTHLPGVHLGMEKTHERVLPHIYWPEVKRAVEDYCRRCAECQLHSPTVRYCEPLIPLLIIDVPFSRIGTDILRPLPKYARGH